MIYTTYFAKLKVLPDGVIPIAICAKVPAGYRGASYRNLAPKYDFYSKWKIDHDNDCFTKCYYDQVLQQLNPARVVADLYYQAGKASCSGDIALVCYEKSGDFCHRYLVSEWLRSNGYDSIEFKGDK